MFVIRSLRLAAPSFRWLALFLLAVFAASPSRAGQPALGIPSPSAAETSVRAPRQLLDRPVFEAAPDPRGNGRIYAITLDGLMRSEDGGTTWEEIGSELLLNEVSARYAQVDIDPAAPEVLYEFPGGTEWSVNRSSDGGDSWQSASAGLPLPAVFTVAGGSAGGSVLTAVTSGAEPRVFRSTDRGESWSQVGEVGPIPQGNTFSAALLVVPEDRPSTLYLAGTVTIPHTGPCGGLCSEDHLFRSLDGGATWSLLEATPFPVPDALEIDGRDPATLYATYSGTFYRSSDRGETWEVASERGAVDLVADPRQEHAGGLYRGTFAQGVFHGADGGASWQRVAPDFSPLGLSRLSYLAAPSGPDVLFVAGHEGLWALDVAPPVPQGPSFVSPEVPGFRVWVRISGAGGSSQPVRAEANCLPETLCVSGAVPGRSEVFVRVVGPKPNGRLWPTLVKFTTSRVEVWLEQVATGQVEYYVLPGARPGVDELPGLFDREGFPP